MQRILFLFAAAAAFAICSMPAQATILYDNLSAPINAGDTVAGFGPLADSFSTGGTSITLTDVKVNLETGVNDPSATVSLLGDNSTSPGSLISTLGNVNVSGGPTVCDLSGLSLSLAANTRYWIEVSATDSSILWPWSTDTSGIGVPSEYFYNSSGVNSNSGGPYLMEVSGISGASVPEPPGLPLFALGFLTMIFLGRRRFAR